MSRVNLIPPEERGVTVEARQGSAYLIVGVLGALLVAALIYVLTLNQITGRESDIAKVESEIAEERARGAELSPYERFAAIKEGRVEAVRRLAGSRFDFERLMRELALVLPSKTWVTSLDANSAPEAENSEDVEASAAPIPTLKVQGCTTSQKRVALVLVRLRKLHRATGSELEDSTEEDGSPGSGGGAPSDSAGGGGATGCGGRFKFSMNVTFSPTPVGGDTQERLPAALGGGA